MTKSLPKVDHLKTKIEQKEKIHKHQKTGLIIVKKKPHTDETKKKISISKINRKKN